MKDKLHPIHMAACSSARSFEVGAKNVWVSPLMMHLQCLSGVTLSAVLHPPLNLLLLTVVVSTFHTFIGCTFLSGCLQVLEALIHNGASVEQKDADGWTALHFARCVLHLLS